MTITLTNENWYYLHLEDGNGGTVSIPPETTVELPDYFLKYSSSFIRDTTPGLVPTDAIQIGASVTVYSNNELDGREGVVVSKDSWSYKIDLDPEIVWFPYSEVSEIEINEAIFSEDGEYFISEDGEYLVLESASS